MQRYYKDIKVRVHALNPVWAYAILPLIVINWQALVFNSFWIIGLAILLADFSYQYWVAHQTQTSLRIQFNQPAFLAFFWLSMVFVCIGLAGTSKQLWETIVWAVFAISAVFFMVRVILVYRSERL